MIVQNLEYIDMAKPSGSALRARVALQAMAPSNHNISQRHVLTSTWNPRQDYLLHLAQNIGLEASRLLLRNLYGRARKRS